MAVKKGTDLLELRADAREQLTSGTVPPLLVVAGDEPFLKEPWIRWAAEGLQCEIEPFAAEPGEGEAAAGRRLLSTWATGQLFGGRRLIVVRDAGGVLKKITDRVLATLEATPPNHLILLVDSLDGRSKLARKLRTDGGLWSLPPLRDTPPPWQRARGPVETDLVRWLRAEGRELGLALGADAGQELVDRVGNEPARLVQKLEHLRVLLDGRDRASIEDVRRHVRRSSARLLSAFEGAVREGRTSDALALLDQMVVEGVYDPFGRLVTGPELVDAVLRQLVAQLARTLEAHERLNPELRAALDRPPWQRGAEASKQIDEALGPGGGRRVFLERDVRTTTPEGVRAAFTLALDALRALRDGRGTSLHAATARIAGALP